MLTCPTPKGWMPGALARNDLGADAYLCCPGPSLTALDPQQLRVPGAMVFALNTAYP